MKYFPPRTLFRYNQHNLSNLWPVWWCDTCIFSKMFTIIRSVSTSLIWCNYHFVIVMVKKSKIYFPRSPKLTHLETGNLALLTNISSSVISPPTGQALGTLVLLSVSMRFGFLDSLCEEEHTCVFVWLISLAILWLWEMLMLFPTQCVPFLQALPQWCSLDKLPLRSKRDWTWLEKIPPLNDPMQRMS